MLKKNSYFTSPQKLYLFVHFTGYQQIYFLGMRKNEKIEKSLHMHSNILLRSTIHVTDFSR